MLIIPLLFHVTVGILRSEQRKSIMVDHPVVLVSHPDEDFSVSLNMWLIKLLIDTNLSTIAVFAHSFPILVPRQVEGWN